LKALHNAGLENITEDDIIRKKEIPTNTTIEETKNGSIIRILRDNQIVKLHRNKEDVVDLLFIYNPEHFFYEVPKSAFYNCNNLKTITLAEGLVGIDEFAFAGCYKLSFVTLPASLKYIGQSAFNNTRIASITIPVRVTNIDNWAFAECDNLKTITFLSKEPPIFEGNKIFNKVPPFEKNEVIVNIPAGADKSK